MEIDRAPEIIRPHRVQTSPAVLSPPPGGSRDISVRNTLVPKEEDLRLSISHHDKEIGEHTFLPQALHAGLTDESFSGRFSRDADGFLSWVRTVQRIEGKHLPKGMYIDTFV